MQLNKACHSTLYKSALQLRKDGCRDKLVMGCYHPMQPLVQPKHLLWLTVYVKSKNSLAYHAQSLLEASQRNSRWGSPSNSHGSKEGLHRFLLSASLHNCLIALAWYTYTHAPDTYPGSRCKHSFQAILCSLTVHTPAAFPGCQSHLRASWLLSCMKILLTVCTRPAAIALNCSIKNMRNDVRQIIVIFNEKSRFNSLVWGSLTLAPIMYFLLQFSKLGCRQQHKECTC